MLMYMLAVHACCTCMYMRASMYMYVCIYMQLAGTKLLLSHTYMHVRTTYHVKHELNELE